MLGEGGLGFDWIGLYLRDMISVLVPCGFGFGFGLLGYLCGFGFMCSPIFMAHTSTH